MISYKFNIQYYTLVLNHINIFYSDKIFKVYISLVFTLLVN